jgi:hypothetical protein
MNPSGRRGRRNGDSSKSAENRDDGWEPARPNRGQRLKVGENRRKKNPTSQLPAHDFAIDVSASAPPERFSQRRTRKGKGNVQWMSQEDELEELTQKLSKLGARRGAEDLDEMWAPRNLMVAQ